MPADIERDNRIALRSEKNVTANIMVLRRKRPHYGFVTCEIGDAKFSLFNANDCPTCLSIIHRGAATDETRSIEIWRRLATRSSLIVDVGSHIGLFSLTAAAAAPNARVIAIEASPSVFARLCVNLQANRTATIKPMFLAVSDREATVRMYHKLATDYLSTAGTLESARAGDGFSYIEIPARTLDAIAEAEKLGRIDLLKIDVEDHEKAVLAGFSKIMDYRPIVMIEILSPQMFSPIANHMRGVGYDIYAISENGDGPELFSTNWVYPTSPMGRNYLMVPSDTAIRDLPVSVVS